LNRGAFATRAALLAAAAIAGAGLVRLSVQALRLHFRLARCEAPIAGRATAALSRVMRRSASRRRVRLLVSDDFTEPVACGVFRGTIILPHTMESETSRSELEALLAHEAAHLVRGDTRWLWFGRIICGCLPFQPMNFVGRRAWRQAEEFLCDGWAVRNGARRLDLAHCLTAIAERRLHAGPEAAGVAVGGEGNALSLRVERLVKGNAIDNSAPQPLRRSMLSLVAALLAAALGMWGPQGGAAVEEASGAVMAASHFEPERSAALENGFPLAEELALLHEDWRRAESLLDRLPPSSGAEELVHRMQQRMAALRQRVGESEFNNSQ
jgi:beta-lactamase regulating signal transducer with metallopeptidase domain